MDTLQVGPATTTPELQNGIRRAAVQLLNEGGIGTATMPAICERAEVTETEFSGQYASANAVFADVVETLMAAHGLGIAETLVRRRSMTESIRVANQVFWKLVEERIDDHQALMCLRLAEINRPGLAVGAGPTTSIHDTLTTNAELWLIEIERVHEVRWELPINQLATQIVASMYGLILDYLTCRDSDRSRRVLDTLSFDLAQRGRRRAKNQSY